MLKSSEELVHFLKDNHLTISSVESYTGGLFAKSITDVSGSSAVFIGSLVSYATRIKIDILGVDKNLVETKGVVSKEVAKEMAVKGRDYFKSDICVSFTGNAGPNVCEDNKQVGECYSTIVYRNNIYEIGNLFKNMSRDEIRVSSIDTINKEIIKILKNG